MNDRRQPSWTTISSWRDYTCKKLLTTRNHPLTINSPSIHRQIPEKMNHHKPSTVNEPSLTTSENQRMFVPHWSTIPNESEQPGAARALHRAWVNLLASTASLSCVCYGGCYSAPASGVTERMLWMVNDDWWRLYNDGWWLMMGHWFEVNDAELNEGWWSQIIWLNDAWWWLIIVLWWLSNRSTSI